MKKIFKYTLLLGLSAGLLNSCGTDSLEPTLAQDKSVEGSIINVGNLYSIIKGVHSQLTSGGYYGQAAIITNEVRSDNMFSNGNSGRYSTQAEFKYNENTDYLWNNCYSVIANANIIINTDINTLDGDLDYGRHIQGQATAIRALGHYDLLRSFGQQHAGGSLGVPIITTFKGSEESLSPSRNTIDEVKAAIYADLEAAFGMMDVAYDSKIFISKYAAKALEARVALYFGDWSRASAAAKMVIDNSGATIAPAANFVSNWTGKQAGNSIFELQFSASDNAGNGGLAYMYRYPSDAPSGYGDAEAIADVIDLYADGDVRKDILGYQDAGTALRNMGKYPDIVTTADNVPLIRIEEVVLIYAEALFEINNADPMALTQLNSITSNRGAAAHTMVTKDILIEERRKELIFEGFRFDDLMRTGQSIDVIGSSQNLIETLTYPNNLFTYPIPAAEINANSNVVQNEGY
ncbi:RagB/SusD family nutrient uptake outer membrane protein [Urechidicola vernalis]|uniref:RagB/SusD family nutrient uptake outer membrane protein n=1 Tax=Urechidicola vernalis TaxID=3075600 RepID=A0ABU2Y4E5_9FLAO|nr:RagB/SusD family nutrient uptake outer membrane protein [Urechidicola sp. P050]MDT0552587.1 RagB/SusD family nutrient uptake outer membrane protein [Urechidicola sp. P050]